MNKLRDSSVNVVSVFVFTIIFWYHIKRLLIIFNFLKREKSIVSNWYQKFDHRLIRESLESVFQF